MPSIPLKVITDMYNVCKAKANKYGEAEVSVKDYTLYMNRDDNSVILEHYGTVIFRYVPKYHGFDIGGANSRSDVDAINSMVKITGKGKSVQMRNGKISFIETVKRVPAPFGL